MDRLSAQDASFLQIEGGASHTHMHVGSLAVFEGPPPGIAAIRRMVAGKLPLVPRYRQRVRFVPLNLGRPVWLDDPHFHLDYHVRHTALPPPGGDRELRNLVGRIMSQDLDHQRPLWEMWVIEGLTDDRWAIFSKTHHALVDGASATELLTVILDRDEVGTAPVPDTWRPEPEPTGVELAAAALTELALSPYEQWRAFRSRVQTPAQLARQTVEVTRGVATSLRLVTPSTGRALNGPITPHRRWTWARSGMPEVKTVRAAFGGTVNDVVLAVTTRGFRDLLLSRGMAVDDVRVRTLVPVSVRTEAEKGTPNNRVSGMVARLPVGIEDPVERLGSIKAQLEGLKSSKQAVAAEALSEMSGFAPPMLVALGSRLSRRLPQQTVNTVTTNVPGPKFPLYAAGRPLIETFPYVPLGGSIRIGVAIFSYLDHLNFGITGDFDNAPDIDVLADGIEAGMTELVKLAEA